MTVSPRFLNWRARIFAPARNGELGIVIQEPVISIQFSGARTKQRLAQGSARGTCPYFCPYVCGGRRMRRQCGGNPGSLGFAPTNGGPIRVLMGKQSKHRRGVPVEHTTNDWSVLADGRWHDQ